VLGAAEFLRNVPILAGLADDLLIRVAAQMDALRVPAGEWIVRTGEGGDTLFIIRSGSAEVVDEGPPESVLRTLRRGEVLGELALLGHGARSASVRARRDVDLLTLGRAQFETLIQESSFALGLTRAMGSQLALSRSPIEAELPPRTIGVVGLDDRAPAAEVASRLAGALADHGSVAELWEGELETIAQAERDADRVMLCGGTDPEEAWTQLCVREADLVVAVGSGVPVSAAWRSRAVSLKGCELLMAGPLTDTTVLESLEPREVQVVSPRARLGDAYAATARRLAGRSVGVVLSGGGARAFAHLGVLEELLAAGVTFDRIAGVSLGALIAASAAAGFTPDRMLEVFERSFVATNPTNDYVPPAYSLIRGAKTRRLLEEAFGDLRIEQLPLRFFCVSCDLIEREPVVRRTGPVAEAVYQSLAIPGVFPPVPTSDGRLLVDGGVLDNLPVSTMAHRREGPIIAVDVTGRGRSDRASRPRLGPVGRSIRRALTGSEVEVPRLGETIVRAVVVGSSDTVAAARRYADVVITPRVGGIGLMDWRALGMVRELGREAARRALESDPGLQETLGLTARPSAT
jgi:NTE family protein